MPPDFGGSDVLVAELVAHNRDGNLLSKLLLDFLESEPAFDSTSPAT